MLRMCDIEPDIITISEKLQNYRLVDDTTILQFYGYKNAITTLVKAKNLLVVGVKSSKFLI